jgi:hypothetical protein
MTARVHYLLEFLDRHMSSYRFDTMNDQRTRRMTMEEVKNRRIGFTVRIDLFVTISCFLTVSDRVEYVSSTADVGTGSES